MPIKLYSSPKSPPCQAVLMVGQCLGINFETIDIAPMKGDHLKPEYLEINPQHTIPTIIDEDGFVVWESRTIARYLSQAYGKTDSLYPIDLKKRINVDKMLDFDLGTLYKCLSDFTGSLFTTGEPNTDAIPKLDDALSVLEKCIQKNGSGWTADDTFTIADIFLFMSVNILTLIKYDLDRYGQISMWLQRVKTCIPNYDVIGAVIEADFKAFHESLLLKK